MTWKPVLASIAGSVDQERLLRHEDLVTEHRLLHQQITGRGRLRDAERKSLAAIGTKWGTQALGEVASIVRPDTILAGHRKLITRKCDGSQPRKALGRPTIDEELEALVVHRAGEHRSWGYDRLAGARTPLGYTISDQTVGNILKRDGLPPAPARKQTTTWQDFIRTPRDGLVATDLFTTEVWTWCGLVTSSLLFFRRIGPREVHLGSCRPPKRPSPRISYGSARTDTRRAVQDICL